MSNPKVCNPVGKYENCFNAYCDVEDKIIDCAAYDIFKAGYDAGFRQFSARIRCIDTNVDGLEEARLMFVDEGVFLGTVGLQYRNLRAANIRQLYVKEDCRGRGIGSHLVDYCCGVAKVAGCETLGLVVNKANDGAREFYKKLGFIFAYQYDNGDDLMTKVLGS